MSESDLYEPIQDDSTPPITQFDQEQLLRRLKEQQNLGLGILGGAIGMVIGAVAWGVITALSGYQIGYLAVGIGFLVGLGVQKLGKGFERQFQFVGAGLALLGCILGDLLVVLILVSKEFEIPLSVVIMNTDIPFAIELLTSTFDFFNLVFYGLAIYAGYKYSVIRLTQKQVLGMNA